MRWQRAGWSVRPSRRQLLVVAGVTTVLALPAYWASPSPSGVQSAAGVTGSVTLDDDDQGVAMFDIAGLAPGHPVSRCLSVAANAGSEAGAVTLHAAGLGGKLAPFLGMTMDVGSGGSFQNCAGFRGRRVYEGTLASFADDHSSRASALATTPAGDARARTYRFTFDLADDPAAQNLGGVATFVWDIVDDTPVPPVLPEPDSAPVDVIVPTPDATAAGEEQPQPVDLVTVEEPGAVPLAARTSDPWTSIVETLAAIQEVALDVAKKSAVPMFVPLLVLGFLTLQGRIDSRDPKLALAPMHRDPDLQFLPLDGPGPGGGSSGHGGDACGSGRVT